MAMRCFSISPKNTTTFMGPFDTNCFGGDLVTRQTLHTFRYHIVRCQWGNRGGRHDLNVSSF